MESKVQKAPAICKARENAMAPCSMGQCYTSFVATKVCLPRQSFCHKIVLSRQKFSRDKYLSRQAYVCRVKHTFFATEDVFCRDKSKLFCHDNSKLFLSRQTFCRGKICFVATKMMLVADPVSDKNTGPVPSSSNIGRGSEFSRDRSHPMLAQIAAAVQVLLCFVSRAPTRTFSFPAPPSPSAFSVCLSRYSVPPPPPPPLHFIFAASACPVYLVPLPENSV